MTAKESAGSRAARADGGRGERHRAVARLAASVLGWGWEGIGYEVPTRHVLRGLLVGLYLAHDRGQALTMRQACDLMGVDYRNTGPRYIRFAVEEGLIAIEERAAEDRRKTLLKATPRLLRIVGRELARLEAAVAADAKTVVGEEYADENVVAVRPYLKLMQDVRPEDLTEEERKNGERHETMLSERINVEPKNAHIYCFRGEVRRALGRVGEAIADVAQAIKLDPTNGTFRVRRGQWLLLMGRAKEATVDLERGIELGLKDYEEYWALSELNRAYAVLGDEQRKRATIARLKKHLPSGD